jgi:hypothetical protein
MRDQQEEWRFIPAFMHTSSGRVAFVEMTDRAKGERSRMIFDQIQWR